MKQIMLLFCFCYFCSGIVRTFRYCPEKRNDSWMNALP